MDLISTKRLHAVYVTSMHSGTDLATLERWLADNTEVLAGETSFYIVRSPHSRVEIRNALLPFLSAWELLLVLEMKEDVAIGSWGSDSIQRMRRYFAVDSNPA